MASGKMSNKGPKYRDQILLMMLVAGEKGRPSHETTTLVENIVHEHVVHMLVTARDLAARRGSARFTVNDLLFQVRHNPARIGRLRNFLRWRRIRKTATKMTEKKPGDGGEPDADDDAEAILAEESGGEADMMDGGAEAALPLGPSPATKSGAMDIFAPPLPWSVASLFPHSHDVLQGIDIEDDDEEDTVPLEPAGSGGGLPSLVVVVRSCRNPNSRLARLLKDDERTRDMTSAEYAAWSDARTGGSFLLRKKQLFREWTGLGVIADYKASEEVPGILGFLVSEWVQSITEEALRIKRQEDEAGLSRAKNPPRAARKVVQVDLLAEWEDDDDDDDAVNTTTCIGPRHVRAAVERLLVVPKRKRALLNGTRLRYPRGFRLL